MDNFESNEDWMKKFLFASVFIDANKLQTIFDRYHPDVSSKQWLLMVIAASFETPPTLTEVAEAMGCSRQNVKKIAAILEKKGYLSLQKELKDGRSICIVVTDKFREYANKLQVRNREVLEVMFKEFTKEQIKEFYESTNKLARGIEALESYFSRKH
jgi:DNA-binding MarR family transcriptional regulator